LIAYVAHNWWRCDDVAESDWERTWMTQQIIPEMTISPLMKVDKGEMTNIPLHSSSFSSIRWVSSPPPPISPLFQVSM